MGNWLNVDNITYSYATRYKCLNGQAKYLYNIVIKPNKPFTEWPDLSALSSIKCRLYIKLTVPAVVDE